MKPVKRMLALVLALLLVASLAASALATSPELVIKPMPLKQWIRVEKNAWGISLYKLTLKSDSRVTVNWKECTDSNYYFYLFKNSADAESSSTVQPLVSLGPNGVAKGSKTIAVAKGTYYAYFICALDSEPAGQVKVTATAIADRGNYIPSKAYKLKKGTLERIAQVPMKTHACWYKIKLTAAQKITVFTMEGRENRISIYNKHMQAQNVIAGGKKVVTANACDPSTYYIRVDGGNWFANRYVADNYITIKWK